MKRPTITTFPRWPLAVAALGPLLALAGAAHAQTYNTGEAYNTGSLYHAGDFTNAAGASFLNTGSAATAFYAGSTFANAGRYAASAGATDQFIGPAGVAGPQELGGTVAPRFFTLTLANGPSAAFTVSNPQGVRVSQLLTLSNGLTRTVRTTPAGAIRLLPGATIGGTLSDARYVDGYVGQIGGAANAAGFVLPVGTAGAYQPLTLTTALTNAADSVRTAYFASDPGTTPNPSDGLVHPRTSTGPGVGTVLPLAFWDWARPAAAPTGPLGVRVALPAGITVPAARLLLVGWNAAQARWENLSGAGNTATGNTRGATLSGTVPAGITALALAEPDGLAVRLLVALQGPLTINNSSTMGTGLNDEGVLEAYARTQPYRAAPWNYAGSESVAAGYFAANPTLVDWVLVELRAASDYTTILGRQACLLRNDGVVLTAAGSQTLTFPGLTPGAYYLSVRHRNHLTVLSSGAQALSATPLTYDFTTGLDQALDNGNGNAMVRAYGKWALWAGNSSGAGNTPDESVDALDNTRTQQEARAGYFGEYRFGDVNLDGVCDALDNTLQKTNGYIGPFSPLF